MGQYHKPVNFTKKETFDPHKLGCGLKLLEQASWGAQGGVTDALWLLMASSSGRGGGDYGSTPFRDDPAAMVGRWAGDRVAIVGDYSEETDIPVRGCNAKAAYGNEKYRDITDDLIPVLEREFEIVYVGEGWRSRLSFHKIPGYKGSHGHGDRMIMIGNSEFPASQLRAQIRQLSGDAGLNDAKLIEALLQLLPTLKPEATC